jgi:hypothetical protein
MISSYSLLQIFCHSLTSHGCGSNQSCSLARVRGQGGGALNVGIPPANSKSQKINFRGGENVFFRRGRGPGLAGSGIPVASPLASAMVPIMAQFISKSARKNLRYVVNYSNKPELTSHFIGETVKILRYVQCVIARWSRYA